MNESQMTHTQGWWSLSLSLTCVLVRYFSAFITGPFLSTLSDNFGIRGIGDDGSFDDAFLTSTHCIVCWSNGTCDVSCAGNDRKNWIKVCELGYEISQEEHSLWWNKQL